MSRSRWCLGSHRSVLVAIAVIALTAVAPTTTRADDAGAEAHVLYKRGVELMAAGDYQAACAKLEASLQLDETMKTSGKLAECYEADDRLANAWSAWRRTSKLATPGSDADTWARGRISHLEQVVARLTVTVTTPTPGLVITRDGRAVPAGALDTPIPVNKGPHTIVASAPGYHDQTIEVSLANGAQRSVEIGPLTKRPEDSIVDDDEEEDPQEDAQAALERSRRARLQRWIGLGVGAGGGLVVGIGGLVGLSARSERDSARELGCNADLSSCPPDGRGHADSAYSRAIWATGLVVTGAALAVGGALTYLLAPRDQERVRVDVAVSPDGVGVTVVGVMW